MSQHFSQYADKFMHLLAGFLITSFVITVAIQFSWSHPVLVGFIVGACAGAGKEVLDWMSSHVDWVARLHRFMFHEPTGDVNLGDFLCTLGTSAITAFATHLIL